MKRLVRAQQASQHTPQEWLVMLFDKVKTPPEQPGETDNTRRWLFKYSDIKPENIKIDKWYHFLRNQFNQLSNEQIRTIFNQKFPSEKNNVLNIEVLVASIVVTLEQIKIETPKQPNLLQRFLK